MRYPVSSWGESHYCWPLFYWGRNVSDVSGVSGRELPFSAGEGGSKGRDLLLVKREGLVGDAGQLGYRGHEFLDK